MNKLIRIIVVVIIFTTSCTKDFVEINTNPNNPDAAPISNVFANTVITLSSRFGTDEIQYPASFVGYASRATYNDAINYSTPPPAGHWSSILSTFTTNLNVVIEKAKEQENYNTQAAAMVMKSYGFQMLVDAYGQVPYFEAGMGGQGNFTPKFDSEETIYNDLIIQLEEANLLFNSSANALKIGVGDVLLANNIGLWKKFANSLQLRIAIRMSNVDPTTSKSIIEKILNDPIKYPILSSNNDNILLNFPGEDWREPWRAAVDLYVDVRIGAPIVDSLKSLSDPRLMKYAEVNGAGQYVGLVVGADGNGTESKINALFVGNEKGSVPFMKYTEIEFIKAEAYARLLNDDVKAKEAYNKAITASMQEYGISQTAIDSYLSQLTVTWDGNLDKLYTQKWIALFRQSWEAWAEMRRTDIPTLSPAVDSNKAGHNRTPFRFSYPDTERSLNGDNIPKNVVETDNYWGTKIWWDTRTGVN